MRSLDCNEREWYGEFLAHVLIELFEMIDTANIPDFIKDVGFCDRYLTLFIYFCNLHCSSFVFFPSGLI